MPRQHPSELIAQHQGWMCLNYGLLLTAPVQRYGWLAFGSMAPQMRQVEAYHAVSDVLIPLSLMVGKALSMGACFVRRQGHDSRLSAGLRALRNRPGGDGR